MAPKEDQQKPSGSLGTSAMKTNAAAGGAQRKKKDDGWGDDW